MDLIKHSLAKVMSFSPHVSYKAYNTLSFLSVSIVLKVSRSMEVIMAKKFVMVGSWWISEAGTYFVVMKVS